LEAGKTVNLPRLLFWAVLFCALVLYVLLFEQPRRPAEQKPAEKLPRVFNLSPQDITGIEIVKDGRTTAAAQRGAGWEIDCRPGVQLSQELIDSLVNAVADTVMIETVADNPGDLVQYGLDEPRLQLSIIARSPQDSTSLLIGKDSPSGVSAYALLRGSTRVMLIGKYLLFSINSLLEACR
jgi:hypothetical protein